MTAAILYETDSDFRALIQCWIDNRRCPLPMADYLRERGLEGQAEAAEWSALMPDKVLRETEPMCGPFPRLYELSSKVYSWCPCGLYLNANCIPQALADLTDVYLKTEAPVLLLLLDRWAKVKEAGGVLPKVEAGVVTN